MIRTILALSASASLLAACGTTTEQRVASGALGGAAVGAVAGGELDDAAVGAALGAGAGYVVVRCKKSGDC